MNPSRYPSAIRVTNVLNYVDPDVRVSVDASPDATATGDGLAIQGSVASIKAGIRDPNSRITGRMGSIFLRAGADVEYNAYLKEADDGLDTGWFPIATLGGKAGGTGNMVTFGLTDDTVGLNAAVRYGNIVHDSYPIGGAISLVGLPTAATTILDIKFSSDLGATWHSIFPPGNDDTGNTVFMANKINVPVPANPLVFNPLQYFFSTFQNAKIPAQSLLRIDSLQSGGATGINVDIEFGPIPPTGVSGTGGSGSGMWVVIP